MYYYQTKLIYVIKILLENIWIYIHFPSIIHTKLHFSQVRKFNKSLGITQKTKPKLMQIFNMNQKQEKYFYLFSLIHTLPGVSPLSVFLHTASNPLLWFKEILQQIHIPAKDRLVYFLELE